MGEGRLRGTILFGEALGVEGFGIAPIARSVVRAVDVHDDGGAGGDDGVAYAIFGYGFAIDHPEGWVEAECFVDDLRGEDEFGDGGEVEGFAVEDLVELVADAVEDVRVRAQEIEQPGEGVGGGLVAGYEELHAFAEDEGVGHAFAVGVASVHEGLEEVGAGLFVAAHADVFEQNLVGVDAHLFVLAQLAGGGEPRIEIRLQRLPNDEFLDGGDGVADEVDVFVFEARAEERARHHGEGHLHEVGVDVDGAVVDLAVELAQRVGE